MQLPIYLDHHATTPVDARVLEAMLPYFTTIFGNPASINHSFGQAALEAVEQARVSLARNLGAAEKEIVFTSGATESNNLAIFGVAERGRRRGNHFVSIVTEHKAVLDPLRRLEQRGCSLTLLPVLDHTHDHAGSLDLNLLAESLRDDTALVSVMLANNEIGVLHPLAQIAEICHARGIPLHCDATQAVGKMRVNVRELGIDFLSCSAHKFYGPKGCGLLYLRKESPLVRLEPRQFGGGHERGLRSGTLPVPGIVGMAKALELSLESLDTERERLAELRWRLYQGLQSIPRILLNGPKFAGPTAADSPWRLPGNLNCSFLDVDGEALMMSMAQVAVSSGAACTSTNPEPSHVLQALGLSPDIARASLRFGLGRGNTAEEIDFTIQAVADQVARLRQLGSSLAENGE